MERQKAQWFVIVERAGSSGLHIQNHDTPWEAETAARAALTTDPMATISVIPRGVWGLFWTNGLWIATKAHMRLGVVRLGSFTDFGDAARAYEASLTGRQMRSWRRVASRPA